MSQSLSVPFHVPSIGEEEINEVVATLRSGWLTTGPRIAQFEQEFRAYVGASHALAVNSCTAGLHLALAALKLGPGDEVITTPLTFCATVNTILQVGATPVLADVRPDGNLDPASVIERISAHISILNFTYKPLDARFHLCLCRFECDEDGLEVETQWVRPRTSHFSYRSTVR